MINNKTSLGKLKISTPTVDLSSMHSSEIFEKYGFCSIGDFKDGFAPFAKMKGKKRIEGWISSGGQVLVEGFKSCGLFTYGYAIFTKIDGSQGWIGTDGKVLKENLKYVYPFDDGHGIYINTSGTHGVITNTGEVIIDGLDKIINFNKNGFGHIQALKQGIRMDIYLYKSKGSKFYVFRDNNNQGQGWISTDCKQILTNKKHGDQKYFGKCYPFGNEIKGYGQFLNGSELGYIDSDGNISDIKRILSIPNQLITEQGFKCLSLLVLGVNKEIKYIDKEGRLWEDVTERNGIIYVKKDGKEYNRKLIK